MSMAEDVRSQQLSRIRESCARQPRAVLFDEPGQMLMDVPSGRALALDLPNLAAVEEHTNKQTQRPYLVLAYGDGKQLALAEVGIAFAPDTRNTEPLPDLPEVACLADYRTLSSRLEHFLYGHPDSEPDWAWSAW